MDTGDQHIVTASRMQCPERCIAKCHFCKRNMVTVFHVDQGWSRIKISSYVLKAYLLYKSIRIAIYHAGTGNGNIVRVFGIDKRIRWL